MFKIKKVWDLLLIFFLSLTPLLWFRENEIIVGHDNVFALNPITFLMGRFSTWIEHGFGQGQDLIMGTIPIHLIDAIPYMLGFSLQNTEKIVYVFWFFMMGLSAYILSSTINPRSRIFQLTSTLLYQFNFFILQAWWIGERTKFSAYIAMPLILAIFLKVYRKNLSVTKGVIYSSLIFFIFNAGGLYGIPLYGGLFIVIGIFLLSSTVFSIKEHNLLAIKRMILLSVFSCIGFFLVNSYYFFPAFARFTSEYATSISNVGGVGGLIEWANAISANTSYINLMRLQGIPEWYDNVSHPYAKYFLNNPLLIITSFIWPLLLLFSLFTKQVKEHRKLILIFFLIYLTGILFSAGTHKPLGEFYTALMSYIPGFAIFRTPYYKFAPAIFLASSFLIAYSIDYLQGKKKTIAFLALFFLILVYHFPYFTGDIFSWREGFSTRLKIPEYVINFGKWLNSEKKDELRVLMLPPNDPDFRYSSYDWGYLSFQSLPTLLSNEPVVINNDRVNDNERKMIETLYKAIIDKDKSFDQLVSSLRIGYVVLQGDSIGSSSQSPFPSDSEPYENALENLSQLRMVKKFGKWRLYQIESFHPTASLFYTDDKATIISGQVKNSSLYSTLASDLQTTVRKEDLKLAGLDIGWIPTIYSPNCLKCKKKDRPFIKYPDRNVLPDSPFYNFVLYNEEKKLHLNDPKSLTYDYIGLVLKRFAEIREMIERDTEVKEYTLNKLEGIARQIQATFKKLTKEEKFDVAEDLSYYIDDLRTTITAMLGDRIRVGLPVVVFTRILSSIGNLELTIDPYLFKEDITQNRLYNLPIDQSGQFEIYVHSKEFEDLFRDKFSLKMQIDNEKSKELSIDKNVSRPNWLSFGNVDLQKGDHEILFSFGDLTNLLTDFSPQITEFNSNRKAQCYTSRIQNFDSRRQYKMVISYINNQLGDVNLYTWEEKENGIKIHSADRLRPSIVEQEFVKDIQSDGSVKGVVIGMCAVGLTRDYLQEQFDIKVHEFVEPVIAFVSRGLRGGAVKEASFQKLDTTKYTVSFATSAPNSILTFSDRFDKGWSLKSFEKNHVLVNGFANGWIIDKPSTYSLRLEYKPQSTFKLGLIVSGFSVLAGVIYLAILIIKERRKIR